MADKSENSIVPTTAAVKEIFEAFTPAERVLYDELQGAWNKKVIKDAWWFWEFAKRLVEIEELADSDRKNYKRKLLERLSIALNGPKCAQTLAQIARIARAFPTKESFSAYIDMRCGNTVLSVTHLMYLASVSNESKRQKLAKEAVENKWTAAQLYNRIREAQPEKTRDYGGRTHKMPTTLSNYLNQIQMHLQKILNIYRQCWSENAYNIGAVISSIPAKQLTEDMFDHFDSTIVLIQQAQDVIARLAGIVKNARQAYSDRLDSISVIDEDSDDEYVSAEELDAEDQVDDEENM